MSKNHTSLPKLGKSAREYVALIWSHGYNFDRVNSKGIVFYTHRTLPEQRVNPLMTDGVLHNEVRRFNRLVGIETKQDRSKRDAAKVKERQARQREHAAEELARIENERAQLIEQRESYIARFGVSNTAEANAIVAQIERADREARYWFSLMTETPASGHSGVKSAAHRA